MPRAASSKVRHVLPRLIGLLGKARVIGPASCSNQKGARSASERLRGTFVFARNSLTPNLSDNKGESSDDGKSRTGSARLESSSLGKPGLRVPPLPCLRPYPVILMES